MMLDDDLRGRVRELRAGGRGNRPGRMRAVDEDVVRLHGLSDLITPMVIRVAATLRLADQIAAGTTTLTELAADVDADPDALGRSGGRWSTAPCSVEHWPLRSC
jgi:hypothetical protein